MAAATSRAKWLLKIVARLAAFGLLAIFVLVVVLWIDHRRETRLPTPTGPFLVSRSTFAWSDETVDSLAPIPRTKRTLVVWLWFPTRSATQPAMVVDYLPVAWRNAVEKYRGKLISNLLERDLARVRAHSTVDGEVSLLRPNFPVIIMRAGLSALTIEYTSLAEDLASHGYVVVGFDAPYRTQVVVFPDGEVVHRTPENDPEMSGGESGERIANDLVSAWSADVGFVLDRLRLLNALDPAGTFTNRLDMSQIGIFGHSLGGATAAKFCHDDARCKAGIDVDGAPYGGVVDGGMVKPFMFLMSDHGDATDAESRRIESDIHSIFEALPHDSRELVTIRGANHYNFSDGAVLRSPIVLDLLSLFGVLRMDGPRQLAVTSYLVRNFFDAHLKNDAKSKFDVDRSLYPEIE